MTPKELKKHRKDAGFSQTALAEKMSVSLRTIQNWETGFDIPPSQVIALRSIFDKENADISLSENLTDNNEGGYSDEEMRRTGLNINRISDNIIELEFLRRYDRLKDRPLIKRLLGSEIEVAVSKKILKITETKEKLIEYLKN